MISPLRALIAALSPGRVVAVWRAPTTRAVLCGALWGGLGAVAMQGVNGPLWARALIVAGLLTIAVGCQWLGQCAAARREIREAAAAVIEEAERITRETSPPDSASIQPSTKAHTSQRGRWWYRRRRPSGNAS